MGALGHSLKEFERSRKLALRDWFFDHGTSGTTKKGGGKKGT